MEHEIDLPEPWEHVEKILGEERERLEAVAGSGFTEADLGEHDEIGGEPFSHKAWLVRAFEWNKVRNTETGSEVLLRLQTLDGNTHSVSSAIFLTDPEKPNLSGTDLRSFPVAALAAAYSYDKQSGRAHWNTFLNTLNETYGDVDPLTPLPAASSSQKFSALVARQYRHIEEHEPGQYIAGRMAELNSKPLATVQRWVTQARKAGFLPPIPTGRRPND